MQVGIVGATGFVGSEMLRLLLGHPEVEVAMVTSRQAAGRRVDETFPALRGRTDLKFEELDVQRLAEACQCAVLAVPHKEAMPIVPALLQAGLRVVDYSADFRLKDPEVYEQWYATPHVAPELLAQAAYGLVERHRDEIREADLIAVPGCYPTAAVLGLAPLLEAKLIDPKTITIVALSSVTGAGATATPLTHYSAVADTARPYAFGGHRHLPEIETELGRAAGGDVRVTFLPHVVPIDRGILCTMSAQATGVATRAALEACLRDAYADAPCVAVCDGDAIPEPRHVRGSNRCDLAVRYDDRTGRVVVLSALDNLVKGAAGQAVQCLNVRQGWPETLGLPMGGLWP